MSRAPLSLRVAVARPPEGVLSAVLASMKEQKRWWPVSQERTSLVYANRGSGQSAALKGLVGAERLVGGLGRLLSFGVSRRGLGEDHTSSGDWESLAVSVAQGDDGRTVVTFSTHGRNARKLAERLAGTLG